MGYKMPTKYHLSNSLDRDDYYTLEIPFLHNFDVLLAENYTVEVILPYGASEITFDIPFDIDSSSIEKSTLTLDFFGTPKLVFKKSNVFSHLHAKNIKVSYKFDERYNLVKPVGLSLTIFGFFILAIFFSRISLSFAEKGTS